MPVISTFFGIVIRMFYREHGPPHFHAEYQGQHVTFTFDGGAGIAPETLHERAKGCAAA